MKNRILSTALIVCGALALLAGADEGVAMGHMIVNGKTCELTHAYAIARPDSFHKEREELRVILSDATITEDELRHAWDMLDKHAADGSFHAISIILGDGMFDYGHRGRPPMAKKLPSHGGFRFSYSGGVHRAIMRTAMGGSWNGDESRRSWRRPQLRG